MGATLRDGIPVAAQDAATQRALIGIEKKNYIINGAMMISQENGTTAGTATNGLFYYGADQFGGEWLSQTGTINFGQVASVTPGGSPNRFRCTVAVADASVTSGKAVFIAQHMEGYRVSDLRFGTASAKTITLQFGVRAPAGTYCVVLENNAGTRSYVAEYVISVANTDTIVSGTIPGDGVAGAGLWLTNNLIGLRARWGLMAGSTYQQAAGSWGTTDAIGSANQFNFMGTNGNVFELFDVGLYEGGVAPAFIVPDYQKELAECQRHWFKTFPYATVPAQNAGITGSYCVYSQAANQIPVFRYAFPVPMRAAPTMTFFNPSAANANWSTGAMAGADGSAGGVPTTAEATYPYYSGTPAIAAAAITLIHFTANARL